MKKHSGAIRNSVPIALAPWAAPASPGREEAKRTLPCIHGHFFSPQLSHQVLCGQRSTPKRVASGTSNVATAAASTTFALPRDPLTKITGNPDFAAATSLCKELCENAMSVRSAQGRQRGHLGATAPPNERNAMPGAQPRSIPRIQVLSRLLPALHSTRWPCSPTRTTAR
jgi:hypothetical protein